MLIKMILRDIAPEFTDLDEDLIDRIIVQAENELDKKQFGNADNKAIALLTAHILTLREQQGNEGNIASKKEGDLAISFGQGSESSIYREELARLKRSFIIHPVST